MSESDGIQVKFSADIQSLLSGMKDGQEAVKTATEGMKGDLGSMIESFEKFGMAAVAIGSVGLAFEGIKEGMKFMMEAAEQTNALARSFEGLEMMTGANVEDLSAYRNAMVLTGGSTEDLSGVMGGLMRSLRTNSEVFIANGIAASKSALDHQDLLTTLAKTIQVIAAVEDPGKRAVLAMELLGRSAAHSMPQLMRMNEIIEKEGVQALSKYGAAVDEVAIKQMQELERAMGEFKLMDESVMQDLAEGGQSLKLTWEAAKTGLMQYLDVLAGGKSEIMWVGSMPLPVTPGRDKTPAPAGAKFDKAGNVQMPEGGGGGGGHTAEEIAADKAAAAERIALAKGTAEEIAKAAMDGIQEQLKSEKSLADQGEMSFEEQIGLERQHATEALQIELDKDNKLLALEKGKPLEIQKTNNDIEAAQRAFNAKMSDLDNQQAQMRVNVERETDLQMKKLAEEAAKESAEVAKIAARESLAAAKDAINEKKKDLDLEVAMGQITGKQEVAQRIAFIQQEEAAEKQQLQQELTNQSLSVARRADINAQIVDLERRTQSQIDDIKRKAAEEQFNSDMAKMQGMEANWNQGIQKMLAGQESLSKGLKSAMMGIGEYWEKTLIDMGLKELNENAISLARYGVLASTKKEQDAATAATKTATTATSNSITDNAAALSAMVQIADWAAVAEAAAFAAYAGIPVVGPALGLAAAAEAGATTMSFMSGLALSSAAGGWDQVPSDQLAMIHKNEMILPAPLAQSVRDMSEAGGGGATHVHLHGVTDASWWAHNQAHIVGQVREAMRNNRMGAR